MTGTVSLESLPPDQLLDAAQASEFLGAKVSTLAVWRCTGRYDLPYVKVGRSVRYRVSDLVGFVEKRTIHHTGQMAQPACK